MTFRAMSCAGDDALECLVCGHRCAEPFCSSECRERYEGRRVTHAIADMISEATAGMDRDESSSFAWHLIGAVGSIAESLDEATAERLRRAVERATEYARASS